MGCSPRPCRLAPPSCATQRDYASSTPPCRRHNRAPEEPYVITPITYVITDLIEGVIADFNHECNHEYIADGHLAEAVIRRLIIEVITNAITDIADDDLAEAVVRRLIIEVITNAITDIWPMMTWQKR